MKKILFSLLILLLTSYACTPVVPNSPSNESNQENTVGKDQITLEGVLEDESGEIITDATVIIKENNDELARTTSDENGFFSVTVKKTFDFSYFIEAKKDIPGQGVLKQTQLISFEPDQEKIAVNFKDSQGLKKEADVS